MVEDAPVSNSFCKVFDKGIPVYIPWTDLPNLLVNGAWTRNILKGEEI
jgi:hypothetical protein